VNLAPAGACIKTRSFLVGQPAFDMAEEKKGKMKRGLRRGTRKKLSQRELRQSRLVREIVDAKWLQATTIEKKPRSKTWSTFFWAVTFWICACLMAIWNWR